MIEILVMVFQVYGETLEYERESDREECAAVISTLEAHRHVGFQFYDERKREWVARVLRDARCETRQVPSRVAQEPWEGS